MINDIATQVSVEETREIREGFDKLRVIICVKGSSAAQLQAIAAPWGHRPALPGVLVFIGTTKMLNTFNVDRLAKNSKNFETL